MTAPVPRVVELAGSPSEIGCAHGEELRDEIREMVAIYREVLALPATAEVEHGRRIRSTVVAYDPAIAEELDGIADGAGVAAESVYALNGRSELMGSLRDGCTTVHIAEAGLLGQTWDWLDLFESRMVMLRVRASSGPTFVTLTEPGIAAKLGCNSAGIGVALNFMYADGPLLGVPIHVVLRRLLGAATDGDARDVLDRSTGGKAGSIHVASQRGWGVNVEYLGDTGDDVAVDGAPVVHTNHAASDLRSGGVWLENSVARLERARHLVEVSAPHTPDELFALLADDDGSHPIRGAYVPYRSVGIGTVATVVLDLPRSTMHVRMGNGPDAPVTSLSAR